MAFQNGWRGPDIVSDGLVLYLDAGSPNSYKPVFGTTWRDLSGFNNSGSLINGPTYDSANGGSIVFDGVDDYILLPTNFFNPNTGTPFSVSFWFKTSAASGIIFGQQSTNIPNGSSGWVPAIYVNTNGNLTTSCFWGGAQANASTSTTIVNNNSWHNVSVTFESTSHVSYLNGTSFSTISKTQTNYSSVYYYFIGSGTQSTWPLAGATPFFNGIINNMLFYNKALSSTEVLQNYNAQKSRFGL
jgi:hypothetical protein